MGSLHCKNTWIQQWKRFQNLLENGNDSNYNNEEEEEEERKETYGFRSSRAPPPFSQEDYGDHVETLEIFEEFMYSIPRRITFKHYTNTHQEELKKLVAKI